MVLLVLQTQYMALEIQFRTVTCMNVIRICKTFWATFHSHPSDMGWLQCVDVNNRLQICKLYDISNDMLLTNNLITSAAKQVKFEWCYEWLLLSMHHGSRKLKKWLENECTLHRSATSSNKRDSSRTFQYVQRHLVDSKLTTHTNENWAALQELYQRIHQFLEKRRGNYCCKLRKRKVLGTRTRARALLEEKIYLRKN